MSRSDHVSFLPTSYSLSNWAQATLRSATKKKRAATYRATKPTKVPTYLPKTTSSAVNRHVLCSIVRSSKAEESGSERTSVAVEPCVSTTPFRGVVHRPSPKNICSRVLLWSPCYGGVSPVRELRARRCIVSERCGVHFSKCGLS